MLKLLFLPVNIPALVFNSQIFTSKYRAALISGIWGSLNLHPLLCLNVSLCNRIHNCPIFPTPTHIKGTRKLLTTNGQKKKKVFHADCYETLWRREKEGRATWINCSTFYWTIVVFNDRLSLVYFHANTDAHNKF